MVWGKPLFSRTRSEQAPADVPEAQPDATAEDRERVQNKENEIAVADELGFATTQQMHEANEKLRAVRREKDVAKAQQLRSELRAMLDDSPEAPAVDDDDDIGGVESAAPMLNLVDNQLDKQKDLTQRIREKNAAIRAGFDRGTPSLQPEFIPVKSTSSFDTKEYDKRLSPSWKFSKDGGKAALQYLVSYAELDPQTQDRLHNEIQNPRPLTAEDFVHFKADMSDLSEETKKTYAPSAQAYDQQIAAAQKRFTSGKMSEEEKGFWQRERLLEEVKKESTLILPLESQIESEFWEKVGGVDHASAENLEAFCNEKTMKNQAQYDGLVNLAKSYDPELLFPSYDQALKLRDADLHHVVAATFNVGETTDRPGYHAPRPENILFELAHQYNSIIDEGRIIERAKNDLARQLPPVEKQTASQ